MKIKKGTDLILLNKGNKVFLQLRTDDAPLYANHWSMFGGGMEEGETPEEAMRREAYEELEIKLTDLKFFRRYTLKEKGFVRDVHVFVASCKLPLEKLKKQLREGEDVGLFSFNELKNLKMIPNDLKVLRDFFKKI